MSKVSNAPLENGQLCTVAPYGASPTTALRHAACHNPKHRPAINPRHARAPLAPSARVACHRHLQPQSCYAFSTCRCTRREWEHSQVLFRIDVCGRLVPPEGQAARRLHRLETCPYRTICPRQTTRTAPMRCRAAWPSIATPVPARCTRCPAPAQSLPPTKQGSLRTTLLVMQHESRNVSTISCTASSRACARIPAPRPPQAPTHRAGVLCGQVQVLAGDAAVHVQHVLHRGLEVRGGVVALADERLVAGATTEGVRGRVGSAESAGLGTTPAGHGAQRHSTSWVCVDSCRGAEGTGRYVQSMILTDEPRRERAWVDWACQPELYQTKQVTYLHELGGAAQAAGAGPLRPSHPAAAHLVPSATGSHTSRTSMNFSSTGPSSARPGASSACGVWRGGKKLRSKARGWQRGAR